MADAPTLNATRNDFPPDHQPYDDTKRTAASDAMAASGPLGLNVTAKEVPALFWAQVVAHRRTPSQLRKYCKAKPKKCLTVSFNLSVHPRSNVNTLRITDPFVIYTLGVLMTKDTPGRTQSFVVNLPRMLARYGVPGDTIGAWMDALTDPMASSWTVGGTKRVNALYTKLLYHLSCACANCAHEDCFHLTTCFDHVQERVEERVPLLNAGDEVDGDDAVDDGDEVVG